MHLESLKINLISQNIKFDHMLMKKKKKEFYLKF